MMTLGKRQRRFQGQSLNPVHFCILIMVFALSTSFGEGANASSLVFLGNKNIAPVVYLDNSTPAGIAVDIVRSLAKYIPQPIEIRAMDWLEAQALVAQGKADVLIQINQTEERNRTLDFSDALLESQFSIFTQANNMDITGLSSLRGLRVGVESGGLPQQFLEKNPHILLTIIPNFPTGFKLLSEKAIDAVVIDYRVGTNILAENHIQNIKATGEPIAFSYSSFAVKKGNTKLLDEINNALRKIKADGTYQKIIETWKPKEGVFQTREQLKQRNFFVAILIVLLLFLIAIVWMATLKKELTKRKAAEAHFLEQFSTLRSIINSTNALIFSVDRHYHYTSFNLGHAVTMKMLYGAEIEQGHCLLEYMTVLEDRETAKGNLDRALAGEQFVEEAYSGEELRSRQYFQVSHSPIRTGEGVIGVAVLSQDMTARKQAELEIRQLNQELEQRVLERTSQLESANRELESFAYSVSHDLRAPLRHIDGFLALLQNEIGEMLDEKSLDYMATISDSATRMAKLIDDLLAFSRLGRNELSRTSIVPGVLLEEVIREFEPETKHRTIRWNIAHLPAIEGDRNLLRQVFFNLVSNAVKYSRTRPQAEITIGSIPGGKMVTFFIRDNGVGFDMKYARKLFGVFQRLHRAEEFEGNGIGLANVRRIINRHGGEIWAEGKIDEGATFFFSLPSHVLEK